MQGLQSRKGFSYKVHIKPKRGLHALEWRKIMESSHFT